MIPTLRCFLYWDEKSARYIAECIDLNLIARGKSATQAVKGLEDAIRGYLATAFKGDPSGLVPRRSPASRRALYHWFKLRNSLRKARAGFRVYTFEDNRCYY